MPGQRRGEVRIGANNDAFLSAMGRSVNITVSAATPKTGDMD